MNVLFLTHRLPYEPNRGDRIRAYHILRALHRHANVEVVSLVHNAEEASHVEEMRGFVDAVHLAPVSQVRNRIVGVLTLATKTPLTHTLLDSAAIRPLLTRLVVARRPDVVLAYCSGMARFALEPPLAGLPFVIDLVDVDSLKWAALAKKAAAPMKWIYRREARWLSQFEARAAQSAFATVVVNERERDAIATIAPDARIDVVPSGVDCAYFRPPLEPVEAPVVVFCGVMNYAPNEEAAVWLAREVWPLVLQHCGDARLVLVGSHPTARVSALSSAGSHVEVTGHVADVRPYLWGAAVAAAPLHTARGVQNKVLEAVAAGLPVVVTPAVAEGLPHEILRACSVAEGASRFADALAGYLRLPALDRRRVAERADLSILGWNRRLAPLADLLSAAAESVSARADSARRS